MEGVSSPEGKGRSAMRYGRRTYFAGRRKLFRQSTMEATRHSRVQTKYCPVLPLASPDGVLKPDLKDTNDGSRFPGMEGAT
jgi:hypothetical protein